MTCYAIGVRAMPEETLAIWGYGPKSGIADGFPHPTASKMRTSMWLGWENHPRKCESDVERWVPLHNRIEKCENQRGWVEKSTMLHQKREIDMERWVSPPNYVENAKSDAVGWRSPP